MYIFISLGPCLVFLLLNMSGKNSKKSGKTQNGMISQDTADAGIAAVAGLPFGFLNKIEDPGDRGNADTHVVNVGAPAGGPFPSPILTPAAGMTGQHCFCSGLIGISAAVLGKMGIYWFSGGNAPGVNFGEGSKTQGCGFRGSVGPTPQLNEPITLRPECFGGKGLQKVSFFGHSLLLLSEK